VVVGGGEPVERGIGTGVDQGNVVELRIKAGRGADSRREGRFVRLDILL
jgi:hypothetical protein